MRKIDHKVLLKAEFLSLNYDNEFMEQLRYLSSLNIEDAHQVKEAVIALEILKLKLTKWINENKSALESEEAIFMINIYEKHLALLKEHEGVNFNKALVSYKMCLRVFQFIMAALYDYPDRIFSFVGLPQEIREIV